MMNRREALVRLGGLMGIGMAGINTAIGATTNSVESVVGGGTAVSGKPFSFAHITDVHLFDKSGAEKWFAECLHHIQAHPSKPSLIVNTGDCVMDTLNVDRARADQLWKLWRDTLDRENSLPVHHTLGNHDVFGLGREPGDSVKEDPLYGKKLGLQNLGIERSYYSFDHGDWHFIALDSIHPTDGPLAKQGWVARLDDEQFEWLKADLEATPSDRPIVVYCHIPIVQACTFRYKPQDEDMNTVINPHIMMSDSQRLVKLFEKHQNVKLCLSGHIHLRDRVELTGTTYICDGAVCGNWWSGARMGVNPGYSITTLHPDGHFDYNYVRYGWNESLKG